MIVLLGALTISVSVFSSSHVEDSIKIGESALESGFIDSLIENKKSKVIELGESHRKTTGTIHHEILYKILISDSMGEDAIKELFNAYRFRTDVAFYIQGLLPNEKTITDASLRIFRLLEEYSEHVPLVYLDPTPFEDVNATVAPMILAYQNKELLVFATGLTNTAYVYEKLQNDHSGNLGDFGETNVISERNLTEIFKERAEKIDTQKLIENAKSNYWPNVKFIMLPEAKTTTQRIFTPMMTLNRDVMATEGVVIARKGDSINTLDILPFTMRIVVFDATNESHIKFVKSLPKTHLRTKLITTQYDRKKEWDAIKHVERSLGQSVFMLTKEIITGFDLRVIPSVIEADNSKKIFLINEVNVREL